MRVTARPAPHHSTIHNRNENTRMTDVSSTDPRTNTSTDDDVFESSSDEFASKFHLRDRLVMIYPTGKTGTRPGENGKAYEWVETYTVVLDDGPEGWQAQVMDMDSGSMVPNLVDSVELDGVQVLKGFQWSAGGVVARLKGKSPAENNGVPVGLLGRIDAKAQKGRAAAWRPNPPTEADKARAVEPEIKAARLKARDEIVAALKASEVEDAF
jgi:hypothetical protein